MRAGVLNCVGFTLVEMTVTLALIATVAALVVPSMDSMAERMTNAVTVHRMASHLRDAAAQAATSGRDAIVTFDVARHRYRPAHERRFIAVPQGLHLRFVTARNELRTDGVATLRFFGDGGATGGGVELTAQGWRARVLVDWLTGRVTVHEDDASY